MTTQKKVESIKTIILCGKQCIALRGHREDINSNNNCGNFLAILKLLSETNSELKDHLDVPSAKNATYISPGIQNKLIHIISYDVLQKQLIDEVKEAKFFSIMADEVEVIIQNNYQYVYDLSIKNAM